MQEYEKHKDDNLMINWGEMNLKNYKGIIYAIMSSAAFGLMPIFAKLAYENGSNPTSVLIFRFILAALMLFLYLKLKKINMGINKKQLIILLFIGSIGYTVTTHTLFRAYDSLGAGLATTLHFIYPAVVCLIGFICFKDKLGKRKVASLLLAAVGVYSLIAFEDKTLNLVGVALALLSGVTYGINVIALGLKEIKVLDNRVATMYLSIFAAFGMLIDGIFGGTIVLKFNGEIILSYIGIALVSTILSIILLLKAIDEIGAASASILGTFEPIVSIILGVLIFKETLSITLAIGTGLILISTVILAKDK